VGRSSAKAPASAQRSVVARGEGIVGGAGGCGDEAGGGAEVVVACFAFVRAAGGFMAPGANRWSSAMTGSGVMTVWGGLSRCLTCHQPRRPTGAWSLRLARSKAA
jgi:hypothetical protein